MDRTPGQKVYTDADIEQASELAKLGDAEAEANLGVMLTTRGKYQQAASWYKRAADVGLSAAAYNLGTLYYNGQGFQQDYAQALHWFEAAAKRNDAYAEFQLGMMDDLGRGVEANPEQEMYWYTKAARQGLSAAQYNLAVIYHNAEGVQQDDVKAYAWLLLARARRCGRVRGETDRDRRHDAGTDGSAEALSRSLYVASNGSLRE